MRALLPLLGLLLSTPAMAGPTWTLVLPLGVPQFTHHAAGRGLLYASLQLAAGGVATWSTLEMRDAALAGDIDREIPLRFVSAGAVAGFATTWFISSIDGSRLHDMESMPDPLAEDPSEHLSVEPPFFLPPVDTTLPAPALALPSALHFEL